MNQIIRTTPRIHPLMAAAAASVIVVSAAGVGVMTGVLPGSHANVQPVPAAMAAPASLAPALAASASPVAPQIIVQAAAPTSAPKAAAPKPRVTRVAAVEDYVPYEAPRRSRQPLQSAGNAPRSGDPYEPNPYGNTGGGAYGGPQEGGNGVYGGGYRNAPVQVTQAAPVQAPAPRPICGNCGVIEAITENTVAGAGTGIGGIGGALGGAVIGKQFGKGRGSDALAILGAIGGAVAGHQVEKSVRSTKVYEVRVKMEDGSTRSMTQASPPAWRNGDRVRVDGNSISVI